MPNLTGSTVTAAQLERHLHGTPLAGHGVDFVNAGRRYRIDPRLLVSIASAESSLGRHAQGYNPFGWGPGIHFNSWGQAIDTVAGGLRSNYLGKGLTTIEQIGAKYAPQHVANDPTGLNSNWVKNVKAMYRQLGGGGSLGAGGDSPQAAPTLSKGPPAPLDLRSFVSSQMAGDPTQGGRAFRPTEILNNLVQQIRSMPQAPVTAPGHVADVPVEGGITSRDRKAVSLVMSLRGIPYVWGGTSKAGFDCSGLLQYVWKKAGVNIPRVTYDQWDAGTPVGRNGLRPGDAVFFRGSDPQGGKPGHVGMYIGGGKFVEAARSGTPVRVSRLAGRSDFMGARRYA